MTPDEIFRRAVDLHVSDLHIVEGEPPIGRIHGALVELDAQPISGAPFTAFMHILLAEDLQDSFARGGDIDTSYAGAGHRWRVHAYTQRAGRAFSIRRIPSCPPPLESLGLPESVVQWSCLRTGLVLITGPTSSGKTTTAASILDRINTRDSKHIVTIEDPIEFVLGSRRSLVSQREVGTHVASFSDALRSSLREDPDIIFVGEMRDLETVRLALQAAETGHLVISTLHTSSVTKTIARIVDLFPAEQQPQVRAALADTIEGIIAQDLVVNRLGDRSLVAEVLVATSAVRSLIREGKAHHLEHVLDTSASSGMRSRAASVRLLREQGVVE